MASRRKFLKQAAATAIGIGAVDAIAASPENPAAHCRQTEVISLCGRWKFRIDPDGAGLRESWFAADGFSSDWLEVNVPHTWQVDPQYANYRGVAWYHREFDSSPSWTDSVVRIEFEAVFHSATVWVNGKLAGEHLRKGYTPFVLDVTSLLHPNQTNRLTVRVDGAFNDAMLPRGRSSDWAHDGGIFRPVQFLVTPKVFLEKVHIDAIPDLLAGTAELKISASCKNMGRTAWHGKLSYRVVDEETGLDVLANTGTLNFSVAGGASQNLALKDSFAKPKLWHFDSPRLYRLELAVSDDRSGHQTHTTFGVRRFEIASGQFHLNGERVRLMGVERMAGSNPNFGMAEPREWIEHDHNDLKNLNCVFTRVHWPQDKRVLDFCDRHGILMQSEIPVWGAATFRGRGAQPDAAILENGLEQLRETIARDRNHPSVVVWGLCNEIGGQAPAAYQFARRMLEEAKRLDPQRLCSYASNSLYKTPERDVAALMDFVETNEYFGTWEPGTAADAATHFDSIHAAFPGKPIVVSEYGYCACTPDRPEDDAKRIDVLKTHDAAIRSKDSVGGAIFFCYNDYRTHVGDRGIGALQQRIHGVVDLYGERKPSYQTLRDEASPIESLTIEKQSNQFHLVLKTRNDLPSYTLRNYKVVGVFFGQGDIPVESQEKVISTLAPGATAEIDFVFSQTAQPLRVRFEVLRPTRFSAYTIDWRP